MTVTLLKPVREIGVVIGKRHLDAKPVRVDINGKEWPATEEKFLVEVISCDEDLLDKETGILNGTKVEYSVPKDVYDKVKFLNWAKVKYNVKVYGEKMNYEALSFSLLENFKI